MDKTSQPTISPAPTLETSELAAWQVVTLTPILGDLYDESHKSLSYYITDLNQTKLLRIGTLCPEQQTVGMKCWEDLPDGEYVLRLGGATTYTTATLNFCNMKNAVKKQTQVFFRIDNRQCTVITALTKQAYCNRVVGINALFSVDIALSGVSSSILHIADSDLTGMFRAVLPIVVSAHAFSVSPTSDGLVVTALLTVDASEQDLTQYTSLLAFESMVASVMANQGHMLRVGLADSSKDLHSVTSVIITDIHMENTVDVPSSQSESSLAISMQDSLLSEEEVPSDKAVLFSTMVWSGVSIAGYILAVTGVLVALVMTMRSSSSSSSSSESSARSPPLPPLPDSKARVGVVLSQDNLRELIAMEDDALRTLSARQKV